MPNSNVLHEGRAPVRADDPLTSHEAADSVDVKGTRLLVLQAAHSIGGDFTDEDLLHTITCPPRMGQISPSGVRTRRHELMQLGFIEDTGRKAQLASGRWGRLYALTEKGRAA